MNYFSKLFYVTPNKIVISLFWSCSAINCFLTNDLSLAVIFIFLAIICFADKRRDRQTIGDVIAAAMGHLLVTYITTKLNGTATIWYVYFVELGAILLCRYTLYRLQKNKS